MRRYDSQEQRKQRRQSELQRFPAKNPGGRDEDEERDEPDGDRD